MATKAGYWFFIQHATIAAGCPAARLAKVITVLVNF
jgi:hypothetical protein